LAYNWVDYSRQGRLGGSARPVTQGSPILLAFIEDRRKMYQIPPVLLQGHDDLFPLEQRFEIQFIRPLLQDAPLLPYPTAPQRPCLLHRPRYRSRVLLVRTETCSTHNSGSHLRYRLNHPQIHVRSWCTCGAYLLFCAHGYSFYLSRNFLDGTIWNSITTE